MDIIDNNTKRSNDFLETIRKYPYPILLIITIVVFFQSLFFDYINFDDDFFRPDNPQTIGKIEQPYWAISTSYINSNYYRPIVNLSFTLDAVLDDSSPFIHHLTNLAIHCIFICMLFILFRKLKLSFYISFFAALVFAVHPLLTNAVVWTAGRNDMLAGLFSILAFIFYLSYFEKKKSVYMILHGLALLLAVFSKELAMVTPFIIAIYWFVFLRNDKKPPAWKMQFVFWLLPVLALPLAKYSLGISFTETYFSFENILINSRIVFETLSKTFIPFAIDPLPVFSSFRTISGAFAALALIVLVIVHKGKRKTILFGLIWFLVFIIPGLFMRTNETQNDYIDCRAYLPLVGILIALAGLLPVTVSEMRNRFVVLATVILLMVLSITTFSLSKSYKDPVVFWEKAVKDNPDKPMFLRRLGSNYSEYKKDYDKAIEYAKKTIEISPNYTLAYLDLAILYSEKGKYHESKEMSIKALVLNPSLLPALRELIVSSYMIGEKKEAVEYARQYVSQGGPPDRMINEILSSNK